MAEVKEKTVKEDVKKLLKAHRAYQFWPVQTGFGSATLDCLLACCGNAGAVETKRPGQKLTARQQLTKDEMAKAGIATFVIGEHQLEPLKVTVNNEQVTLRFSGMVELHGWLTRCRGQTW